MPPSPLFVSNRETLLRRLRLEGASSESDVQEVIDEAIRKARIELFDALGSNRITELLAINFEENATSSQGILRTKASSIEVMMVKRHLLRDLPTLFMDASSQVQHIWNEEGMTRVAFANETRAELGRLNTWIQEAIVDLRGAKPDGGTAEVSVIGPDEPKQIGSSLW